MSVDTKIDGMAPGLGSVAVVVSHAGLLSAITHTYDGKNCGEGPGWIAWDERESFVACTNDTNAPFFVYNCYGTRAQN